MWAGASGDYYAIHYDKDFAQSKGLPGVIVHGQLVASFLGQLLTDWIGKQGKLIKLACSYKGMNFPGETITCRGKVSKKYIEDGEHRVECHIWAENAKGEKTVIGKAIVALPARG
jgi:acyl dehydratase